MALILKTPPARQGVLWVRQALQLFMRQPLALSFLFTSFLASVLMLSIVPWVGAILGVAALPLLGLGFMVASAEALGGQRVRLGQLVWALKGDVNKRGRLLKLCALYAISAFVAMLLADALDGGTMTAFEVSLDDSGNADPATIALQHEDVLISLMLRFALVNLVGIPFWHAPALVHWGGQGVAQSLFSSTLAFWRCRAALTVYFVTWAALMAGFGVLLSLLASMEGLRSVVSVLLLPGVLMLSSVFYTSLIFPFNDSFGRPSSGTGTGNPAISKIDS
jgi:hypothetical protein